jgi:hypothetical protein
MDVAARQQILHRGLDDIFDPHFARQSVISSKMSANEVTQPSVMLSSDLMASPPHLMLCDSAIPNMSQPPFQMTSLRPSMMRLPTSESLMNANSSIHRRGHTKANLGSPLVRKSRLLLPLVYSRRPAKPHTRA